MNPPANWYPDPTGRHNQRYWDGDQWTEHVFSDGVQGVDPLEPVPPAATGDADDADADETDETTGSADVDDDSTAGSDESAEDVVPDTTAGLFGDRDAVAPEEGAWTPADGISTTPDEDAETDDAPDEDHAVDEDGAPDEDEAVDDAQGAVAPEVETEDVVASVDDLGAATTTGDFSDAFVLSPETASRLVGRSATNVAATEPGPAVTDPDETDAEDADVAASDVEPTDTADDAGAIDAPPPVLPSRSRPAPEEPGLGISGDLVGGAFAEREDTGAVGLQNSRLLRCSATDGVIARQGTMVAYQGDVAFERQGAGGVGRALKRAATGEGLAMMRVSGGGDVFLADAGQHVFLLQLDGGPGLSVNGRNVLAFSASLSWDIERVKGASLLAGGLFNTTLTGTGWVALVSDGEPVVLRTDDAPTYVDVNALVAWSAGLATQIVNTVTAKSLVGLGSGEAFQMAFDGPGIVIVQPSEGPLGGAGG